MSLPILRSSPSTSQTGSSKAPQACGTCRKQKRRCDKALPSCSLCVRMRRPCDYTEANPQPTAEDFAAMQMRVVELESRLNSGSPSVSGVGDTPSPSHMSSTPVLFPPDPVWQSRTSYQFPSEIFLDYGHWKRLGQAPPKPLVEIPGEVFTLLGDGDAIQQSLMGYFDTVHVWLPMVSKKGTHSGANLSGGGPDLVMLFLAMKLVSTTPMEGIPAAEFYVYTTAKRFLYMLEHSGHTSLMVLQSMVLVAVYEFGHGIYPAAWITVGACARRAEFLGLPEYKESSYVLGPAQTMVELEERRRTWWAVIVLDRVICLGSQRRCVLPDPPKYEALPIQDNIWDEGNITLATQRSCEDAFIGSSSPFARLCEASFLASRALAYSRAHSTELGTPEGPLHLEDYKSLTHDIDHASSVVDAEAAAAIASYSISAPYSSNLSQYSRLSSSETCTRCPNPFLATQSLLASVKIQLLNVYCSPTACMPQTSQEAEIRQQSLIGIWHTSNHFLDIIFSSVPFQASPAATSSVPHLYNLSHGGAASGRNSPIPMYTTLNAASPFILHPFYFSATTFQCNIKKGGFPDPTDAVNKLEAARGLLAKLNGRWRVSGEYMRILESQNMGVPLMATG